MPLTPIREYTTWQEPAAVREARHVGRADVQSAIATWLDGVKGGRRPLPVWIVGTRGLGKSHLAAWARDEAIRRGLRVRFLPEDLPLSPTARALLVPHPEPWQAWEEPEPEPQVIVLEGLDRHLEHWSEAEQGALRAHLRETGAALLATGVTVPSALTVRTAPFYGGFDVWRLPPLDLAEAEALHDRIAGPALEADARARRRALVRVAGGNPRATIALAEASTRHDDLADAVDEVLEAFVPHYQMRFRELRPEAERVLTRIANAPRLLRPRDLGDFSNPNVVLRELVDADVLRRLDGSGAWYQVVEPLFRYWIERRQASDWPSTRAAQLARLLGSSLTRRELAQVWWVARGDLREALESDPRTLDGLLDSANARARDRWIGERPDRACALLEHWARRGWLTPCPELPGAAGAVARFANRLGGDRRGSRAAAVRSLIDELRPGSLGGEAERLADVVVRLLARSEPVGAPIQLSVAHRAKLAGLPSLRARFLVQGRLPGHPPYLAPDDVLPILAPDAPDLPALLSAAHQRGSPDLFGSVARMPAARLPASCPRPERPAPTRAGLLELLLRSSAEARGAWLASAALLDETEWALVVDSRPTSPTFAVEALLGLGARKPERLGALAAAAAWAGPVRQARRILGQLDARGDGPLQTELALAWAALDPGGSDEPPPG